MGRMPDASPFAALWPLDPTVDYLNHGSFGACPVAVLEAQSALRLEMEREPVDFHWRTLPTRLRVARAALAGFVGAQADDLAFVPNATAGVNAVLRSLRLQPGDELLTTDHAYGACRRALEFVAERSGARVVVASVPFPLRSQEQVLTALLEAAGRRTRLALVDHVTSPTALVFPVEQIVRQLAARGIDTLVDGAHALGMVPLDLERLGAAYYTSNAHKWLCAPKGSAFLYVRGDRQPGLHPLSISHDYDAQGGRFRQEFDWTGTSDPTPWLVLPECLRFLGGLLPGGWPELMARNRALALRGREVLGAAFETAPLAPEALLGAMASVALPPCAAAFDPEDLRERCRRSGIETWLMRSPDGACTAVRISAQVYNHEGQYARLAQRLLAELGRA